MKKYFVLSVLACCLCLGVQASPSPVEAVYGLIERIIPGYGKQFELELVEASGGKDVYGISSRDGKVLLKGNNAVSLATAFNQYLKYTCNAHVSWFGDQLDLPERLPLPEKEVHGVINGRYRVYMNYCTVSYTAAYWDWERWQREIDYMAMNSINTPLATVGLEVVWYNTLLKYGFTDEEARSFLAAPGHAAWQWMQNLQSYGGPLPKSWIDKSKKVLGEVFSTIGGYLKVYCKIILITFAELFLAFTIFNMIGFEISYPFVLALIIALVDILPVLGVGTVLNPWALWMLITGDYGFALALFITYLIIFVVRQFIEPKLVSKQFGIHPLITLMAMYAGLRIIGLAGLIIGPIILMVLKCIFAKQLDRGLFKDLFDEN